MPRQHGKSPSPVERAPDRPTPDTMVEEKPDELGSAQNQSQDHETGRGLNRLPRDQQDRNAPEDKP